MPGAPEQGAPRTGLRPWGGEPAPSAVEGARFWNLGNHNLPPPFFAKYYSHLAHDRRSHKSGDLLSADPLPPTIFFLDRETLQIILFHLESMSSEEYPRKCALTM
jgi:hypothetical protein